MKSTFTRGGNQLGYKHYHNGSSVGLLIRPLSFICNTLSLNKPHTMKLQLVFTACAEHMTQPYYLYIHDGPSLTLFTPHTPALKQNKVTSFPLSPSLPSPSKTLLVQDLFIGVQIWSMHRMQAQRFMSICAAFPVIDMDKMASHLAKGSALFATTYILYTILLQKSSFLLGYLYVCTKGQWIYTYQ